MRAGFPHSDISGSKPVCGLPGAFRTLRRPSSPVIAKASTTCTYSLDPITPRARPGLGCPDAKERVSRRCNPPARTRDERDDAITTCASFKSNEHTYASSELLKSRQPFCFANEASRDKQDATVLVLILASCLQMLVELIGFEPTTPCLQSRCSPS